MRTGFGFHSNDARVVMQQTSKEILPRAYGVDLGLDTKLSNRFIFAWRYWGLDLDQEFVYVGDAGIVEPSGKTRRVGLDFSIRYEILPWLFLDGDLNLRIQNQKKSQKVRITFPLPR